MEGANQNSKKYKPKETLRRPESATSRRAFSHHSPRRALSDQTIRPQVSERDEVDGGGH